MLWLSSRTHESMYFRTNTRTHTHVFSLFFCCNIFVCVCSVLFSCFFLWFFFLFLRTVHCFSASSFFIVIIVGFIHIFYPYFFCFYFQCVLFQRSYSVALRLSLSLPFYHLFLLSFAIEHVLFFENSLSLSPHCLLLCTHIVQPFFNMLPCWLVLGHTHTHIYSSLPISFFHIKHRLRLCFSLKLVIMKLKAHRQYLWLSLLVFFSHSFVCLLLLLVPLFLSISLSSVNLIISRMYSHSTCTSKAISLPIACAIFSRSKSDSNDISMNEQFYEIQNYHMKTAQLFLITIFPMLAKKKLPSDYYRCSATTRC